MTRKDLPAVCYLTLLFVLWLACLGALLLSAKPARAQAEVLCSTWDEIKSRFADKHNEVPIGGGQVNPTVVLQVLVSPGGATWTIVFVDRNGKACITAAGKNWKPGANPVVGEVPT